MTTILALDVAGNPFRWLSPERAAYYQAARKIAWEIGEKVLVLRGGVNRAGERSVLEIAPVIALAKSEGMARWAQTALPLGHRNDLLFARDRHICAYCGERIERGRGTRDHVLPRARGGRDVWENTVTACRYCNERKGCRTPEAAGLPLLFVPYVPCRAEHFLLSGRNILADQHEFLAASTCAFKGCAELRKGAGWRIAAQPFRGISEVFLGRRTMSRLLPESPQ